MPDLKVTDLSTYLSGIVVSSIACLSVEAFESDRELKKLATRRDTLLFSIIFSMLAEDAHLLGSAILNDSMISFVVPPSSSTILALISSLVSS